ncbi:MAG: DUF493 family protein [Sulfuricellaceae bacterium]
MEISLLEFPCDFPIKVMGETQDDFAATMTKLVLRHAPDFDMATMEMRSSKGGRYLSLTCTICATSQQQLDDLYREITGHPMVVMAL